MNRPLYEPLAENYEAIEGRDWEKEVDLLVSVLKRYECRSVVDFGCGTGRHALELAKEGFQVLGIDSSKRMIKMARNAARNNRIKADFRSGDYYSLGVSRSYDAALCLNWSIPVKDKDVVKFLLNARRFLPADGVVIFDFEKKSDLIRADLGRIIFDTWSFANSRIARASVGELRSSVLWGREVYVKFPNRLLKKVPGEAGRYDASKLPANSVQTYVDNSFVRFFSLNEVSRLANKAAFKLDWSLTLPRNKYVRTYAVLCGQPIKSI